MENSDKDLIERMQFHSERLTKPEYSESSARANLIGIMKSPQIASPKNDGNPVVYEEFFKYTSALADRFKDWHVMGFLMNFESYRCDASGNIRHGFDGKPTNHPVIKAAQKAPKEFRDFAVSSLAAARERTDFLLNVLIKNFSKIAYALKHS